MTKRKGFLSGLLLAGAGWAALTAPAAGQTPSAEESATSSEDIVVTARRRAENLQDVPVAVSSFSADQLDAVGAEDITAIAQLVPNATLEPSRGTNSTLTAFIRGVGQQDPVAGFEGGVGIYLDDVYLNRPQGAVLDIYDLERIEVLRGPQGTLYGRNTIGGAVKYVTRRLSPEPELTLRGSYGSYNQLDFVASGSTPLSDTFRVGGAVAKLSRDGYGTNVVTGADNYDKDVLGLRLSAEFEPTSTFLVRLAGDYTLDTSNPRQGRRLIPSALTPPALLDTYDTRAGITVLGPIRDNEVTAYGAALSIDWEVRDGLTLRSITAYRGDESDAPIDFDSTELATFEVPAIYENEQVSQELQALFSGDRYDAVLGFYYLDANAFNGFDASFSGISSTLTIGDVDTSAYAVFGELTYAVTDRLDLTVGARYTEDERTARIVRETFLGAPSPFFGGTGASLTVPVLVDGKEVVPEFNGERTDSAFNPRVILAFAATEDLNLYASYAQGFKGGGFDPRGNFANPDVREGFDPEEVESYELGAKLSAAGGRILMNTAVFLADYKDVQIPGSVIVEGPGGTTSFVGTVTNAGAAEFFGAEFEGSFKLTEGLSANTTLGWIDAEYTEFVVNGVDVADQRAVQNTPEWTGNAQLNYTKPLALLGHAGDVQLTGSAAFRSKTQQFETAIPLLDQPAYWLYDASLAWTTADGGLRIALVGKNLGDEEYLTSGYNFPTVDGSVLGFYGPPRTVTGTVTVKF